MEKKIEIHETAFVISTYRSRFEKISKDRYAYLWNNPKTDRWIDDYLKEVSEDDDLMHSLRNRFFYETLKSFLEENKIEVLVNFGCGFSMYPFLLDERLVHIEIDQPDIISYKTKQLQKWNSEGKLPDRNIHFLSSDFNEAYEKELSIKLQNIIKGRSSFILLEGVLFFLDLTSAKRLFRFFSNIQNEGDYVGSVSYRPVIETTEVFNRLIQFFGKQLSTDQEFEYLTLGDDFYENLDTYQLIHHEDYCSLSAQYTVDRVVEDASQILNEHMYVLQKKN